MKLSIKTAAALLAAAAAAVLFTVMASAASAEDTYAPGGHDIADRYEGLIGSYGPDENGFFLEIAQDKREYEPKDEIKLSLLAANRGTGTLGNVTVSFRLPDGISYADESDAALDIGRLSSGEEHSEEISLFADDGDGGIPWYIIAPIAGVLAAAAIGAGAVIIIKKKKGKGAAAALLLALCLAPMLSGIVVKAAEEKPEAPHLTLNVNINGNKKELTAYFSYAPASPSGAELTTPDGFVLTHFGNNEVRMEDEYCENAFELEVDYLLSLDTDRLLAGFRETAGLDTKGAKRYDGWENSLIGGHTLGHYLSACAHAFSNAGISEDDRDAISEKINAIVDGLYECQKNSKGKPGFIFGAKLANRANVEAQFDNIEHGKTNISSEAWVPWYTMHKIIAGLLDVSEFTGSEKALEVAEGLGDWTYERVSGWSDAVHNTVLSIEYGGMNDCLYELYKETGEERYAIAAHAFDEDALFRRVASGKADVLNDLHANTTIPKFLGALNRYMTADGKTIGGEKVDASAYLKYAETFWDMVVEHHTYVTGGNSEWEHFGRDDVLDAERTNCNCETCNVYNMLKLSRALFEITGERKYADYYENAFYNAILSSQNPETGMTMYFQPMATGYFKVYGEPFTKFWCCTGSGMENFSKLNDSIYFHDGDTIYVNMYFSSTLTLKDGTLTLVQRSDIPAGDTSKFTLSTGGRTVSLAFRIPDWAAGELTVKVGGDVAEYKKTENGFAVVEGLSGDDVELSVSIPMSVTAHTLPDNDTALALKYGPVVLSAGLGKQNMNKTTTGVDVTIPTAKLVDDEDIVLPDGVSREEFIKNTDKYVTRSGDGLSFKVNGSELLFTPHYEKYDERYGIYWYFLTPEEKNIKDNGPVRTDEETVDTVQPGYGQYENDELHAMREENTVGVTNDGTYRMANAGGSFTYRMAVSKADGVENYLVIRLRREDNGKTLTVKLGDTAVFSDTLDYLGKEGTYEVRIRIPDSIVTAAERITANGDEHDVISVTFSGKDGKESARVCEFIYIKAVKKLYDIDEKVAYFVDCGDHNTSTLSDGDRFGTYNSVTEQLYGYDPVTGKKWGLIDDPTDVYNGSPISGAIYTANTWAYETDPRDGKPKEDTNRYTKNQYENGRERALDYAFELPDGTYEVEIGFSDPWGCSNMHRVYANLGTGGESVLADGYNVRSGALHATVTVSGGRLTLSFRNNSDSGRAINVTYIKIYFAG